MMLVFRLILAGLGILFLIDGVADVVRRGPLGLLGIIGGALVLIGVVVDLRRSRRRVGR